MSSDRRKAKTIVTVKMDSLSEFGDLEGRSSLFCSHQYLRDNLCLDPKGAVLGLTGPPGVGKSSLTDALIKAYRAEGKRVAVLAIDPSSSVTGGALLGDRSRLKTDPLDDGVFVRSMAARDRLGGLSDQAVAAITVLRAVVDRVIVRKPSS